MKIRFVTTWLVVFTLFTMIGCKVSTNGQPDSRNNSGAGTSQNVVDARTLLKKADAQRVLKESVKEVRSPALASITGQMGVMFASQDKEKASMVQLSIVQTGALSQEQTRSGLTVVKLFDDIKTQAGKTESIPGFGDKAFRGTDKANNIGLNILYGDTYFTVIVNKEDSTEDLAAEKVLVKIILDRLEESGVYTGE